MPTPILATKLYIPPPRLNLVLRSRLIERLNEGLHHKLTLISAAAGFGKTSLVSQWVVGCSHPIAWLSLDEKDNDPTRFLAYLIGALQTVASNIGERALGLIHSPQLPPIESILTALLNEIATVTNNFALVLDDYHVLDAKAIDEALVFLLEHMPPQMHLVITTREDPQFPLARYRARGQMTELRATDLRFTSTEAAEFLQKVMGLNLSSEEVDALETRTEGWIAGLQMAALSMQGRAEAGRFIQNFTGSHRFVLDYLVEEVLQQQPERTRNFLLQTAILERLSGLLCNAVTKQEGGREMLETLERDNLFVIPLDDERHWYRYHHLFADVLQARTMAEQPEQISTLHRRASEWYEQNDLLPDAIYHALAATDFECAARLIEQTWSIMDRSFQSATWFGWVTALPDELLRTRPVLCLGYAWALLGRDELQVGKTRLQDAERWLNAAADMYERAVVPSADMATPEIEPSEIVIVDNELFQSLPARVAIVRAYIAQALGNVSDSVIFAQKALALLPEGDYAERAVPSVLLGTAHWTSGELDAAYHTFADGLAQLRMNSSIPAVIGGTSILADILVAQGRLREAVTTYEEELRLVLSCTNVTDILATEQNRSVFQGMAELYVGLGELYCEQGDLKTAAQYLQRCGQLGNLAMIPGNEYRLYPAMARLKAALGDLDGALDLLDEAERFYYKTPLPDIRPIAALKTRVWVKQNLLPKALGWVRERGISIDDNLSYLREFEHITLVRILIAQYRGGQSKSSQLDGPLHKAMGLLPRLLKAAEAGARRGSVIEILVLQALIQEAQGNIPSALEPLGRALALAEPEGYVQLFVAEGLPMRALLREAAKQGVALNYIRQLQSAFGQTEGKMPVNQPLIEPLSPRELELLALVADGLSNQQIADALVISIATTKKHMSNILGKLSASNRTEAVRRAQDLQLL